MEEAWLRGGLSFMGLFSDLLTNQATNDAVADFVCERIGETVVDPDTADRLKPRDLPPSEWSKG